MGSLRLHSLALEDITFKMHIIIKIVRIVIYHNPTGVLAFFSRFLPVHPTSPVFTNAICHHREPLVSIWAQPPRMSFSFIFLPLLVILYRCVGVWQGDRVEIIANNEGNRTTPSYVSFSDNGCLIGDAAKNRVFMNPYNT